MHIAFIQSSYDDYVHEFFKEKTYETLSTYDIIKEIINTMSGAVSQKNSERLKKALDKIAPTFWVEHLKIPQDKDCIIEGITNPAEIAYLYTKDFLICKIVDNIQEYSNDIEASGNYIKLELSYDKDDKTLPSLNEILNYIITNYDEVFNQRHQNGILKLAEGNNG